MTVPTGNRRRGSCPRAPRPGFTLVELMLVMALLVVVLGYAAPSLSRFFRGRNLDSEARRFLALTRYGQSRAISEGLPMVLWINPNLRTYGLKAQTGYADLDRKAVEYQLADDLQVEAQMLSAAIQTNFWTLAPQVGANQLTICFLPDGFISETSLDRILIRQVRDDDAVWIAQSANRLNYEILTNLPPYAHR